MASNQIMNRLCKLAHPNGLAATGGEGDESGQLSRCDGVSSQLPTWIVASLSWPTIHLWFRQKCSLKFEYTSVMLHHSAAAVEWIMFKLNYQCSCCSRRKWGHCRCWYRPGRRSNFLTEDWGLPYGPQRTNGASNTISAVAYWPCPIGHRQNNSCSEVNDSDGSGWRGISGGERVSDSPFGVGGRLVMNHAPVMLLHGDV